MKKQKGLKIYLQLFLTFMKIGVFTFGGGYAMISLIQKETVDNNHWVSEEDILDIIAIAESTPGPIAINSSTFVGYNVAGFFGAFCATLGMILPSFIIILIISTVLRQFESIQAIKYAFNGIRAGVLALIIKALVNMYKQCPKGVVSYIIAALAFVAVVFFNIGVLYVIIGCALIGLISSIIAKKRGNINDIS